MFVANLDYAVDESALFELFSRYVDVASTKLVRDTAGRSRGFGFVELVSPQSDLERALELNGYLFHGRQIRVEPASSN
jgi:polyadenylate-binding protein